MTNKFVLYIAPFSFPNGGAAARRIYGNCLALKASGYDAAVASGQMGEYHSSYKGVEVYSYNERKFEALPRYLKHFFYFNAGSKAIDFLNQLKIKPNAIVLYSGYSPYLLKLRKWCNKHNVKLIFDAVEWYDPPNIIAKYFAPYYLNIEFAMKYLLPKCDGLIVISKYLESYYNEYQPKLALIPPTINVSAITPRLNTVKSDIIKVCFAGSVGVKKDFIGDVINSVYEVFKMGKPIQLHIAGLSYSDLEQKGFLIGIPPVDVKRFLCAHGLLSHEDSLDLVRDSDFSIAFRPNFRNVQAGFPTKFVESMALGTPVIGNYFSDLEDYLVDEYNGIVCSEYSVEALQRGLLRCFSISDLSKLRKNSRLTAEENFDCINYSEELVNLLN
jgi:glycosyltransferase involved in cell wall biosynthesis